MAHQHVVRCNHPIRAIDAKTGAGIALRVEVNEKDAFAYRRQRGAEVDRGRGLADAAFLVCHCDNARRHRPRALQLAVALVTSAGGHARPLGCATELPGHRIRSRFAVPASSNPWLPRPIPHRRAPP